MSGFANLTGRFRAVPREKQQDTNAGKVRKRPRDSHVCSQCRRSKLRCDRSLPCANCVKRGEATDCVYPSQPSNGKQDADGQASRQTFAEDRLLHLESLVKQLMENQAPAQDGVIRTAAHPMILPPAPSVPIVDTQAVQIDTSKYVGSTHWSAILDDIQELKAVLSNPTAPLESIERPIASTASFVFGGNRELVFGQPADYSLEQLISDYLPRKDEVDRLLSIYFQGETFIVPFIHSFSFQRKYRAFWANPAAVSPLWLSKLFSICCIANLIKAAQAQAPAGTEISKLHTGAAQCLVLGEYYRPQALAVEAVSLYAQCKNLWTLDPSREAGAILGIVVRMAYEMGYHRDPDVLGSFTAFEGEMRRRFWAACKQVDLMISFQLGLPSNIRLETTDTKPPRNLLDSDFDEDTNVLPPSRPESEPTRILWFIVKDRQMPGFSKVCQDALSFREKTEVEVLELDQAIQNMYNTVPEVLRTRPFSESFMDPPFVIMTRLYVEFINLKSLLVLHRRYMARGVVSSTHACVTAGKQLVSQFILMYRELGDGGRLFAERWMLTNFTMNDFLLGTMVLCLAIHVRRKFIARGMESPINAATEQEMISLLEQAHAICTEKSDASKDAQRVARAVRLILDAAGPSGTQSVKKVLTLSSNSSANTDLTASQSSQEVPRLATLSLQPQGEGPDLPELGDVSLDNMGAFDFMGDDIGNVNWMAYEPQMLDQWVDQWITSPPVDQARV